MATLEKREQTPGHVTYRVRWWADGKQRSKSFKVYADARRWKAVLEGDLVNGSYVDPKDGQVTVWSFISEHKATLNLNTRGSTQERIEGIWSKHIKPTFGHLPLSAVTAPLVQTWVNQSLATMSAGSVRKNAHALKKVYDLAVNHGLVRANPVAAVTLPAESKHEQRFLTHSEAWTLAESINPRFRAMVLLAVFGGLRAGEIAALKRFHVIPERNQVAVKETVTEVRGKVAFGPPKTKTSVRMVTIPRSIMAELVSHMETYTGPDPDALVFTGERGVVVRRAWFRRYYWQPATEAAGLSGLRFHDLRHTFVALWVSLGRNPKEVSKAAGHSSVAFTLDRYGHLYETDSDALADELDGLLGLARTQSVSQPSEVSGLTRTHDAAGRPSDSLPSYWPPSSSGPGPRPFTAIYESQNDLDSRRSGQDSVNDSDETQQSQATLGHNTHAVRSRVTSMDNMDNSKIDEFIEDDGKFLVKYASGETVEMPEPAWRSLKTMVEDN